MKFLVQNDTAHVITYENEYFKNAKIALFSSKWRFFRKKIFFDVAMLAGKWPESIDRNLTDQKYPQDVPKFF